jgi:hypothetical protein
MAKTPDRSPGPSDEEATLYEDTGLSTTEGEVRYTGTRFSLFDNTGEFDPRTGGSGITEAQHEVLDTLVHDLSETSYLEVTRTSGQVSDVTVWTNSGKTIKVREALVTRSAGQASVIVDKQYNGAGTLVQTLTHTITRSAGQVASIATVET